MADARSFPAAPPAVSAPLCREPPPGVALGNGLRARVASLEHRRARNSTQRACANSSRRPYKRFARRCRIGAEDGPQLLFSSYAFIFIFLPLTVIGFAILRRWRIDLVML